MPFLISVKPQTKRKYLKFRIRGLFSPLAGFMWVSFTSQKFNVKISWCYDSDRSYHVYRDVSYTTKSYIYFFILLNVGWTFIKQQKPFWHLQYHEYKKDNLLTESNHHKQMQILPVRGQPYCSNHQLLPSKSWRHLESVSLQKPS